MKKPKTEDLVIWLCLICIAFIVFISAYNISKKIKRSGGARTVIVESGRSLISIYRDIVKED